MEHAQVPIDGKTTKLTLVLKNGPVATEEKDLIAEAAWPEDGLPIAGIQMDPGTEVKSNGETFLEADVKISSSVSMPSLNKIQVFHIKSRKYNFLKQQPRSIHKSYVP